MKITSKTTTWTKKDEFAVVGTKSLADAAGKELIIEAAACGEDMSSDTGELVNTAYIRTVDGERYSTVSKTARGQIEALIDMYNEAPGIPIQVKVMKQKCKNNAQREFTYLDLL